MRLNFLLCCESTSLDVPTNRLSVFHIIEQFNTPVFPTFLPNLLLCGLLTREGEDATSNEFKLRIQHSNLPDAIFESIIKVEFQEAMRTRVILEVGPLELREPGMLNISILFGDEKAGGWEIALLQPKPQAKLKQQAEVKTESNYLAANTLNDSRRLWPSS